MPQSQIAIAACSSPLGKPENGKLWVQVTPCGSFKAIDGRPHDVKPLQDTRKMYNSITERSTNTSAELGTNAVQAVLQQFGAPQGAFGKTKRNTPIPWGNVPARPFFPMDENSTITVTALERVMETLEQFAQNALK